MTGIPGMNLLNAALTLIARQYITYYRFGGRTQNSVGQDVTTYETPIGIVGSFQPVPRVLYQQYGLDLQKDYYTFYTSNNILDIQRDVSGDQISFNGNRYQCESNNAWYPMDGWKGVVCVYIGPDTQHPFIWGFGRNNRNFGHGNFLGRQT